LKDVPFFDVLFAIYAFAGAKLLKILQLQKHFATFLMKSEE
jgi:hypothetical protein